MFPRYGDVLTSCNAKHVNKHTYLSIVGGLPDIDLQTGCRTWVDGERVDFRWFFLVLSEIYVKYSLNGDESSNIIWRFYILNRVFVSVC